MESFTHEEMEDFLLDVETSVSEYGRGEAEGRITQLIKISTYLLADSKADKRYIERLEKLNNTLLRVTDDKI